MLNNLLALSRPIKRTLSVIIDVCIITLSYFVAFFVWNGRNSSWENANFGYTLIPVIIITVLVFVKLGLYRAVLRYITIRIAKTVLLGSAISACVFLLCSTFLGYQLSFPILLLYFIFVFILVVGVRLIFRELLLFGKYKKKDAVIIYGAGDAGRQILTALNQMNDFFVVALLDDNKQLQNSIIHGVKVYAPHYLPQLIEQFNIKKILLAIPSLSLSQRKNILLKLKQYNCEILSTPGLEDVVSGKLKLTALSKVSIKELLGREQVSPIPELLSKNITNKVVMVTGAGGSIGSELCRQIIQQRPTKLILFEVNEYGLYSINQELQELIKMDNLSVEVIPLLGSIQRIHRLERIMTTFHVDTIYHAAAYKHVPLVEYNAVEGIRNNIFGTLYCTQVAIKAGVKNFVLISTDKAVRPTNIMGTTKRMAELILQALAQKQTKTQFCMVRFGNVLGSSGSVIPLFERQIDEGGPITLTHPEITRYFMTIPEAAQLVIQAGSMGTNGDVFVLDMGEPVKIKELAIRMINLRGLKVKDEQHPNGDIEIKILGLRPGEKLYEELLVGNNVSGTSHPRIMRASEVMLPWEELEKLLEELDNACTHFDLEKIRQLLLEAPTAFNPTNDICDLVWKAQNQNTPH